MAVSSRAPVWGASLGIFAARPVGPSFKSCPRVGGIRRACSRKYFMVAFQVVPPCGGHHLWPKCVFMSRQFQVVPPCGGHLMAARPGDRALMFQVVPPCGGHLPPLSLYRVSVNVSSRAPVWGASLERQERAEAAKVSSRAPVWGASGSRYPNFSLWVVSSRAPVWGASSMNRVILIGNLFQVVPPCGGHP